MSWELLFMRHSRVQPQGCAGRESKFSSGRNISTKLDSRLRGNDGNLGLMKILIRVDQALVRSSGRKRSKRRVHARVYSWELLEIQFPFALSLSKGFARYAESMT